MKGTLSLVDFLLITLKIIFPEIILQCRAFFTGNVYLYRKCLSLLEMYVFTGNDDARVLSVSAHGLVRGIRNGEDVRWPFEYLPP